MQSLLLTAPYLLLLCRTRLPRLWVLLSVMLGTRDTAEKLNEQSYG
jgi:hypothetical protein